MADAREQQLNYGGIGVPPDHIDSGLSQGLGSLRDSIENFGIHAGRIANAIARDDIASENARLTADAKNTVDRLAVENEMDPEAFRKAAGGAVDGMLTKAHPEVVRQIRPWADTQINEAYLQLVKGAEKREDDAKLADYKSGWDALQRDAEWRAQNGQPLDDNHARAISLLDDATGRRDAEGNVTMRPVIDETTAHELLSKRDSAIASARVWGEYQKGGVHFLADFTPQKGEEMGLSAAQYDRVTQKMTEDVRAQNSQARADESAARAAMADERNANEGRFWSTWAAAQQGMTDQQGNPIKAPTASDVISAVNSRAIDREFGESMLKVMQKGPAANNVEPKDENAKLALDLEEQARQGLDVRAIATDHLGVDLSAESARRIFDTYHGNENAQDKAIGDEVSKLYTPSGLFGKPGPDEIATRNKAVQEYWDRVHAGEPRLAVYQDLSKRFPKELAFQNDAALREVFLVPRKGFVYAPDGAIDINASGAEVNRLHTIGQMSEEDFATAADILRRLQEVRRNKVTNGPK